MPVEPEKKIIVDEDWKSQVERERETEKNISEAEAAGAAKPSDVPLPPASFTYLLSTLYLQATMCLGLVPDPDGGKTETNLPLAKHFIDLLEVLQQKTEGNRTPEESQDLENMLHQLRMAYVQSLG